MKLTSHSVVATKVTIRDWSSVNGSIQGGKGRIQTSHHTTVDLWIQSPETKAEECITITYDFRVREGNALRIVKCDDKPVSIRNVATGDEIDLTPAESLVTTEGWTMSSIWWTALFIWIAINGTMLAWAFIFTSCASASAFLNTLWIFPIALVAGPILSRPARIKNRRKVQEVRDEIRRLLAG